MQPSTPRWSVCRMRCTAVKRSRMMRQWGRIQISWVGTIAVGLALLPMPAKAEERTVNFYNWSNYVAPGVLEDFTKETGIKVVYDTFDANETLETRLLAGNPATMSSSPPPISCSARSARISFR